MKKTLLNIIQIILAILWVPALLETQGFIFVYILVAALAVGIIISRIVKKKSIKDGKHIMASCITGALFSGAVMLANYGAAGALVHNKFLILALWGITLLGGFVVFGNIAFWITNAADTFQWKRVEHKVKPGAMLFIGAGVLILVYGIIFFLVYYPGVLTPDSTNQMKQILTGEYVNDNPIAHTLLIQMCYQIGMAIWNDINSAVAVYGVFQIICMGFCFGYVFMTFQQMKLSYKISVPALIFMAIMPYHLLYSFSMLKDVLWSAACVMMITAAFRLLKNIGSAVPNYIVLAIGALGMCVLRHNGLIAYMITFVIAIFVFGKKLFKATITLAVILAAALIIRYPILGSLGINNSDTIELLAIPAQQIARVIVDGGELTEEQEAELSKIVDLNKVAETYKWYIADDIKNLVRETDNQEYIAENKFKFAKLYIEIGLQHPFSYIKAWVDGTKGYWDSGTHWYRWTSMNDNDWGLERTVVSEPLEEAVEGYMDAFNNVFVLQPFISMGLFTWIYVMLLVAGITSKKKELLVVVPVVAVVFTLMIGTPVWNEMRYAYPIFLCLPISVAAMFYERQPRSGKARKNIPVQAK